MNFAEFDFQKSIDLLNGFGAEQELAFWYWVYISGQELVLRVTQPVVSNAYGFLQSKVQRPTR